MLKKYIDENILLLYSLHMIQLVLLAFYCTKVEKFRVRKFKSTKVQKVQKVRKEKVGVDPKIRRRLLEN